MGRFDGNEDMNDEERALAIFRQMDSKAPYKDFIIKPTMNLDIDFKQMEREWRKLVHIMLATGVIMKYEVLDNIEDHSKTIRIWRNI